MARIVFEMEVAAAPRPIVDALTTADGIRSWWTDDVELDGDELRVGFAVAPKPFVLRVESTSDTEVAWRSVGDFPPHWADTTIVWSITAGEGSSIVHFAHDGWASDDGPLAGAAFTWGQLLVRLKGFAESGNVAPLFTR